MEAPSPAMPGGGRGRGRGGKPLKALEIALPSSKADEELARKLHEELNGPDASSPAAAATRRSRKAPAFYSPQDELAAQAGGEDPAAAAERPAPLPSKKAAAKRVQLAPEEAAVAAEPAAVKSKAARLGEGGSRPPSGRPAAAAPQQDEPAAAAAVAAPAAERKLPTRSTRSAADARPEKLLAAMPAAERPAEEQQPAAVVTNARGEGLALANSGGAGGSMPSSNQASDAEPEAPQQQQQHQPRAGPPRPLPKVPKLPMCREGALWYRARKVEETKAKVLLEFPGVALQPVWLPKDSSRIWTGSYKGKDWRHMGDGAWEPKPKEESPAKRLGGPGGARGRKRKGPGGTSEEEEPSEDDSLAAEPAAPAKPEPELPPAVKPEPAEAGVLRARRGGKPPAAKRAKRGEAAARLAAAEEAAACDAGSVEPAGTSEDGEAAAAAAIAAVAAAAPSARQEQEPEAEPAHAQQAEPAADATEPYAHLQHSLRAASEEGGAAPSDAGTDEAAAALLSVVDGDSPPGEDEAMADARPLRAGSEAREEGGAGLGALAEHALAGPVAPAPRLLSKTGSRKRKRGQPRCGADLDEGPPPPPPPHPAPVPAASVSGGSPQASAGARAQEDSPSGGEKAGGSGSGSEADDCKLREGWRTGFKAKHLARLEELEAEDEAAEGQELLSEEAAEAADRERPAKRPARAIRGRGAGAAGREQLVTRSSRGDTEPRDSPPPPVTRRAGRGRGRWANHVKRGTGRATRPTGSAAETRRAARGRRSGRWASRTPAREATPSGEGDEQRPAVDMRAAFRCIVGALARKSRGLPFQGFPRAGKAPHPCQRLLGALEAKLEARHAREPGWSFAVTNPPIRLFK